ncbi:hypothetical protein [Nocardia sp. NPDC004711]
MQPEHAQLRDLTKITLRIELRIELIGINPWSPAIHRCSDLRLLDKPAVTHQAPRDTDCLTNLARRSGNRGAVAIKRCRFGGGAD